MGERVVAGPAHRHSQILAAGRPGELRRQAIFDVDANHAVAHRPQHDVVIERAAGRALAAADEFAAVHVHEYRSPGPGRLGNEQVERIALVRSIFEVARDLDAGKGLLLVQRGVDRAGFRRIADAADGGDLLGEIGGHLRHRLRAGENAGTGQRGNRNPAIDRHGLPPREGAALAPCRLPLWLH